MIHMTSCTLRHRTLEAPIQANGPRGRLLPLTAIVATRCQVARTITSACCRPVLRPAPLRERHALRSGVTPVTPRSTQGTPYAPPREPRVVAKRGHLLPPHPPLSLPSRTPALRRARRPANAAATTERMPPSPLCVRVPHTAYRPSAADEAGTRHAPRRRTVARSCARPSRVSSGKLHASPTHQAVFMLK